MLTRVISLSPGERRLKAMQAQSKHRLKKRQRHTVTTPPLRIEAVELLQNDIIMGKNKNHPGNTRYRKCIKEWAGHVGDLTMNIVVKEVEESLAPGRFVRAEDDKFFLVGVTLEEEDYLRNKIVEALRKSVRKQEAKRKEDNGARTTQGNEQLPASAVVSTGSEAG